MKYVELNKFFKIILSVGIGLIGGSFLLYLLGTIPFNQYATRKKKQNFSSISNVNKNILKSVKLSQKIKNSKNNRYLELSNYPGIKVNIKYSQVLQNKDNKNNFQYSKEDMKIKEMNDRGYFNKNTDNYTIHIKPKKHKLDRNIQNRHINKDLILTENNLLLLKSNSFIDGNLYVINVNFLKLPKNLYVNGNIYVINSKGLLINKNTTINGHIIISGTSSLRRINNNIKIAGQVFIKS